VRLLAISGDEPHDSKLFAMRLKIWFPLLSDADLAVSRVYAGETSDTNALPGVTIIDRSGRIVFRQVASSKDDRISTQDLLAAIDRSLGTHGPDAADRGFAAIDRAQIRLDGGAGAEGSRGTGFASLAGLFPLSRYLLVGPMVSFEPRAAPLDVDLELVVRAPIWANAGAIELGVAGGYSTLDENRGPNGIGHAGLWFALSPAWSVQLDAGLAIHVHDTDLFGTIGLAWLFRVH
jgi:hypothetical protein